MGYDNQTAKKYKESIEGLSDNGLSDVDQSYEENGEISKVKKDEINSAALDGSETQ